MPRHWLSFSTPLNCGFAFTSFREVNDDGIHTEVRKDEVCNLLRLYSLFCDVSEWCWGQVELQSMSEVNDVGTLGDLNCQDCIMKAGVTWRSIIWHVTQWQPISCKWLRQDCAFMLVDNAAKDLQLQHQQINEPMIWSFQSACVSSDPNPNSQMGLIIFNEGRCSQSKPDSWYNGTQVEHGPTDQTNNNQIDSNHSISELTSIQIKPNPMIPNQIEPSQILKLELNPNQNNLNESWNSQWLKFVCCWLRAWQRLQIFYHQIDNQLKDKWETTDDHATDVWENVQKHCISWLIDTWETVERHLRDTWYLNERSDCLQTQLMDTWNTLEQ